MCFETITYAPIDIDGIDIKYMNKDEITYLNKYHKLVYEKISPYLSEEEKSWLKEYNREI
ncbi:M24 family metallopeptidase C-terminal domain-containing protein [Paraclostridium sordellii]|uniref:M24 family metallopeptidase C-terminal domain-containing protein n=1 Tax=Paraclostridium sordellii TaxID=1505 RepID=UPI002E8E0D37|nr:M24 family metallopeptidase C-terminal domain-containing protein [Paeniclostridium sordellii]